MVHSTESLRNVKLLYLNQNYTEAAVLNTTASIIKGRINNVYKSSRSR